MCDMILRGPSTNRFLIIRIIPKLYTPNRAIGHYTLLTNHNIRKYANFRIYIFEGCPIHFNFVLNFFVFVLKQQTYHYPIRSLYRSLSLLYSSSEFPCVFCVPQFVVVLSLFFVFVFKSGQNSFFGWMDVNNDLLPFFYLLKPKKETTNNTVMD